MSNLKKFSAVLVTAFALTAIAASSASAQLFTYSSKGAEISGMSTTSQVFNDTVGSNLNKVTCNTATTTGTVPSLSLHELTVKVTYSSSTNNECSAFIGTATVNAVSYILTLTASNSDMNLDTGTVNVENPINISTSVGCNLQIPVQTLTSVTFQNDSGSLIVIMSAQNINSTGNGGLCGISHSSGSFVGSHTISGASTINFDITG